MARTVTLKDHFRETRLFNRRVIAAVLSIALAMGVLVARLVYLQVVNHQHYTTLSRNNQVSIEPIAPTRGLIYDRNGVILAENLPTFSLEIVPERVQDLDATIAGLRKLVSISDEDIERFEDLRKRRRRFESVPLRLHLSDEEVARISVKGYRFPGVSIEARLTRHYPLGSLASHVVGYVGRINEEELRRVDASNYSATTHIGKVGVERSYETELHGKVGYQHVETTAQGRTLRVLERTPPEPGKDLYLNIDSHLQAVAERAFGENNGALVAIDPHSGAVLAFVSVPGFPPEPFVNGISAKDYQALSHSPRRPLFNRALQGQYPPGSTLKPFMALAGLELGTVTTDDEVFCRGWYTLRGDDHRYRDWKRWGHGHTDVTKAIEQSCDVYFYDLAFHLGIDRMHDFLSRFGLGKRTGIDILGEVSGNMPSREWKRRVHHLPWFPGETLIAGIGQGFVLTTPLQLANATAALANGGHLHRPRIVQAVGEKADGSRDLLPPTEIREIPEQKPSNWKTVVQAMVGVVNGRHGTARNVGAGAAYTIAGKTGTAQVFGLGQDEKYVAADLAKKLRDHALFISFAPAEDPRIAVAVVVENGGSGGHVAGPIARAVMDAYLQQEKPE